MQDCIAGEEVAPGEAEIQQLQRERLGGKSVMEGPPHEVEHMRLGSIQRPDRFLEASGCCLGMDSAQ